MSSQGTQHYNIVPKFKLIPLLLSYCLQRVVLLNLQLSYVLYYRTIDNLMSRNLIVPCLLTLWSPGLSRVRYSPKTVSFCSLRSSLLESVLRLLLTSEDFRSDLWLTCNSLVQRCQISWSLGFKLFSFERHSIIWHLDIMWISVPITENFSLNQRVSALCYHLTWIPFICSMSGSLQTKDSEFTFYGTSIF